MPSRKTFVPLVALILALVIGAVAHSEELAKYDIVAQNDKLILYLNPTSTEIAVYHRDSEITWYSNPANRDTMEKIARGSAKEALAAQLRISYFMPGDVQKYMNNFNDSIIYGQFEVVKLEHGVRIEYVLGKQWAEDDFLPVLLDTLTLEQVILPGLNRRERNLITQSFVKVSLQQVSEEGSIGSYTIQSPERLRERDLATLAQVLSEHVAARNSSLSHRRDVGDSHLSKLATEPFYMLRQRTSDLLPWDREDLVALFQAIGFTPFDASDIYVSYGLDELSPNLFTFKVPMEYYIDQDNLVVRIPTADIQYPKELPDSNNRRVTYPLVNVDVLPYFGAADPSEQGYMLVPDGSGGLIHLNNGKLDAAPYGNPVYGRDYGLTAPPEITAHREQSYLPVFGMKRGDTALFAIIEDGDAIAQVNANIAGRQISYNVVYPSFRTMEYASAQLQAEMPEQVHGQASQWVNTSQRAINVYQEDIHQGDLKIRYSFLSQDEANYVGMARHYQEYLVKTHGLSSRNSTHKADIPIFIELVGAINDVRPVMGIPLPVVEPLTTAEQAEKIAERLVTAGISNLNLRYQGWLTGGVNHSAPTRLDIEAAIGGKQGFTGLTETLAKYGMGFYPRVDFMLVHQDSLWGFSVRNDVSRFLNRASATVERAHTFSPVHHEAILNQSHVLSLNRLQHFLSRFVEDYLQLGNQGLALDDLGYLLNSDFRQQGVTRQEAKHIISQQLGTVKEDEVLKIGVQGGNSYVLPFVDHVVNLPLTSGGADLIDESVPFYPIVMRGFVDYSGEALNFAADFSTAFLQLVETGAYPYFLGFARDSSFLKLTDFNYLYTGQVDYWIEQAIEVYHKLNSDLREFQGQRITNHQKLRDGVYQTNYESGFVIVNYQDFPVVVDGLRIDAKDYLVVR